MSAPIRLIAYRGYGNDHVLYLRGRALTDGKVTPSSTDDSHLENLWAAYQRLESDEVSGVPLAAHFAGDTWPAVTDSEGYYELAIAPGLPIATARVWHEVRLTWTVDDTPDSADDSG